MAQPWNMFTPRKTKSQGRRMRLYLGKEKRGQQGIPELEDILKGDHGKKKTVSVEMGWAVSNETEK